MKKTITLLLLTCPLLSPFVWSQTNFRETLLLADPVAPGSTLSSVETTASHQDYLDRAKHNNDPEKQFFGLIFLFKDYIQKGDYPEAARCLLEAESIAQASGNPDLQGNVHYRKGILSVYLKNYQAAVPQYEAAVTLCGQAQDSLCMAESLEQLSSMYGRIGEYDKAHHYFSLAMPLLERYGGDLQQCTALNNFANLLALEERPDEAIPYFERALAITSKLGDARREAQFLNNLADSYCQLGRFDQAFDAYRRCISISQQHNWQENLVTGFRGISVVYEESGDYRSALSFYKQFHSLRDSILGAETQDKIAELQVKYDSRQKELDLQKSQLALNAARRSLEHGGIFVFFVFLLAFFGIWRWRLDARRTKRELAQNQDNLTRLTQILLEKNTLLTKMEEQTTSEVPSAINMASAAADFEADIYNQRILTDADWTAFKIYFEKANPGYLLRLRKTYPALSDAEKRLFLFIKLNLTRKESAAILGISPDSVKKTRNRLRHRLGLEEDMDLDAHIHAF